MLKAPLCERTGIRYPVFSVGMGAAAGPELAAAVSPDAPHRVLRNKAIREWESAGRGSNLGRPDENTVGGTMLSGGSVIEVAKYSAYLPEAGSPVTSNRSRSMPASPAA